MMNGKTLHIAMTREETLRGWIYLPLQLLLLPLLLQAGNGLLPDPLSHAALNFVYYTINFAAVCLIFRSFLQKNLAMVKLRMGYTLQSAFLGFLLNLAADLALRWCVSRLYPGFSNVNDRYVTALTAQNYTLMAIGTVFLVPVAEETFYRGLVFQGLYHRSKAAAYIVSTLVFSAVHVIGYVGIYEPLLLLLCFVQYLPAGLCLAWAYARADTIAAPILLHMSVNAICIYAVR